MSDKELKDIIKEQKSIIKTLQKKCDLLIAKHEEYRIMIAKLKRMIKGKEKRIEKMTSKLKEFQISQKNQREQKAKALGTQTAIHEKIPRYKYDSLVIALSIVLNVKCNVSNRGVVKALKAINMLSGNSIGKVPSYQTVADWTNKYGCAELKEHQNSIKEPVALVLDCSIYVNGEEVFMAIAIPKNFTGNAIKHKDVKIAEMTIVKNFKTADVKEHLEKLSKQYNIAYVVSDNASTFKNDIIESIFGYMKYRTSDNKYCGFTSRILIVPVHIAIANIENYSDLNIYDRMRSITYKMLKEWKDEHLLPNPISTRKKYLKSKSN